MTSDTRILTAYDKFHLAACAMERSKQLCWSTERACQEFQTAMVWAREASKLWQSPSSKLL